MNCVGVIDSDYRGEVMIGLQHDDCEGEGKPFQVNVSDRIAQALILPIERVAFEEGDLSKTIRGTQGIGSTEN